MFWGLYFLGSLIFLNSHVSSVFTSVPGEAMSGSRGASTEPMGSQLPALLTSVRASESLGFRV